MKKIVIAGGSGFLGQILVRLFPKSEAEFVILSRRSSNKKDLGRFVFWDACNMGDWIKELKGAEALINLTGYSIDCRHSEKNRQMILSSRLESTRVLGEAIRSLTSPPKVWLNASTVALYLELPDADISKNEESKEMAKGFLADVGRAWEEVFFSARSENFRQVAMRIGIGLGKEGGAYPVMKKFTSLGLGGTQGTGRQWMSWLHADDWVEIVRFLIQEESISGKVNLVSPNPITNADFMSEMRRLHSPFGLGLPAPTPLVYLGGFLLDTAPELILKSQKVISKVLKDSKYRFQHIKIATALDALSKD